MLESLKRLENENTELRELVETLQVRDHRLDKVNNMSAELENLIKKTDEDKKNFRKREEELLHKLKLKDAEIKKI